MCQVGYHAVHGYERTCHSGTKTWVDAHNAKNPKRNGTAYLPENIFFLYWEDNLQKYPSLKAISGFAGFHEIDEAIQFWVDYWKSQGIAYPDKFDPLLVKTIIAVESSFDPNAVSSTSTATGLMQVTNKTRLDLKGQKRKGYRLLKNHWLMIQQGDLKDPIINIAAGTRWLGVKYALIPQGSERNVYNTIKNYKIWSDDGDAYAKKVLALYEKSK